MDKQILKDALDELRKEMRSRVGKKLLSIEVLQHDDTPEGPTDEADGDAQPDASKDPVVAKKMGVSILGG